MITVGQKLFILPIGNAARRGVAITEATVAKAGRKYFYLSGREWEGARFLIESMVNDGHGYSPNYACYFSMQEIEDEREIAALKKTLRDTFEWSSSVRLTLDQMRRIMAIINEHPELAGNPLHKNGNSGD